MRRSTSSRPIPRTLTGALLVGALVTALFVGTSGAVPAAASEPPTGCLPTVPTGSVSPGMRGTGWTVARGATPEAFEVQVVGVLEDAILPGRDLIIAEISGEVIGAGDGVWAGMSGSPVYVGRGGSQRLLGVVAYGFTAGPSRIVGLTSGSDVVALASGRLTTASALPDEEVALDADARRAIASTAGLSTTQVGTTMRRLAVPLSVSGLSDRAVTRLQRTVTERDMPLVPYTGTSAASSAVRSGALRPGDNFAAALSYGDVTMSAVGTASYVCDGRAVAFGHTLFGLPAGPMSAGANTARALVVVKDPTFGPFKLAAIGPRIGRVDADRFAGSTVRLGAELPLVPVTSRVNALGTGSSRVGRTDVAFEPWLPDIAYLHALANIDTTFDQGGRGNATTTVAIAGRRADGTPFRVRRDNRAASDWDIASDALWESYSDLATLLNNPFEQVSITGVDYRVDVDGVEPRRHQVRRVLVSDDGERFLDVREVGELEVQAGKLVYLQVELATFRAEPTMVAFALGVPHDVSGSGVVEVRGGPVFTDPWECLFDPEACVDDPDAGIDGVLRAMATRPRSDELVARLIMFPTTDGEEPDGEDPDGGDPDGGDPDGADPVAPGAAPGAAPTDESSDESAEAANGDGHDADAAKEVSSSRHRLDRVVSGELALSVMVAAGTPPDISVACPPEASVVPPFIDTAGSVHEEAIACLYTRGVVVGVGPDRFEPRSAVSRGQMAALLARTLEDVGVDLPEPADARFVDVVGSVHARPIGQLVAADVLRGTSATTFDPETPMTRGQMATAVVNAYEYATGATAPSSGGWYVDTAGTTHDSAIDTATEARFVIGVEPGRYEPGASVQRGQMATVLARLLNRMLLDDTTPEP